jgi:hypothetical protein
MYMDYHIVKTDDFSLEDYKKTDVEGVLTNRDDNTVAFVKDDEVIMVAAKPGLTEMLRKALDGDGYPIDTSPSVDLGGLEDKISHNIWPAIDECIMDMVSYVEDYLNECPCKGNKSKCPQINELVGENADGARH